MPDNPDKFWGVDLTSRLNHAYSHVPAWHTQPTSIGVWIEAIAGRPRRLVTVLSLDQRWPSYSQWFGPIPEVPN